MESIKLVVDIFAALLSPVIAVCVAYIAYQQWKLNSVKEQRESSKQRLGVYLSVKRFLRHVDEFEAFDVKMYNDLQESIAMADFLFDTEVNEWLYDVECTASCLLNLTNILKIQATTDTENKVKEEHSRQATDLLEELRNAHIHLFDVFKHKVVL